MPDIYVFRYIASPAASGSGRHQNNSRVVSATVASCYTIRCSTCVCIYICVCVWQCTCICV